MSVVTPLLVSLQCPPCRGFTPTLKKIYEKLRSEGRNFEVVFVSSDRSEDSYEVRAASGNRLQGLSLVTWLENGCFSNTCTRGAKPLT